MKIKNPTTFSNISRHTRYYVEFFQNSFLASKSAVFERDIIFSLGKVISEARHPMQLTQLDLSAKRIRLTRKRKRFD